MICIKCSHDTKVTNSRPHKKTPSVWRRRQCLACGTTYSTAEVIADDGFVFRVMHGTEAEPFSVPRLLLSIASCLPHRASAADDAYWLARTIAQLAQATATDTITAVALAELTWHTVSQFDAAAGVAYGAQHGLLQNVAQKPRRGRPRTMRIG